MKYWVYYYDGQYQILQRRCLQQGWGLVGIYDSIGLAIDAIRVHARLIP